MSVIVAVNIEGGIVPASSACDGILGDIGFATIADGARGIVRV